ncbi:hypothetical protein D5S17_28800 [Pseudonocardiaceae bacterium YIM PH 21723]|nr:hypothetical protein D5S17_28800 [Pseudonocardiaceae bacterium YIM PH 21723]
MALEGESGSEGVFPAFVLGGGTPVWWSGPLRGLKLALGPIGSPERRFQGSQRPELRVDQGCSVGHGAEMARHAVVPTMWPSTVDCRYLKASFVYLK